MELYKTLAKYQRNRSYKHGDDYRLYKSYRYLYANIDIYSFLRNPKDEFDLIRANTIIRAILNKKEIEDAIIFAYRDSPFKNKEANQYVLEKLENLPYLMEGNLKVYVPIFPLSINSLYSQRFAKLLKAPFSRLLKDYSRSAIDSFDVYNFSLYDSLFTKLVPIYKEEKVMVMYHYDFHTLYFINNEGRLDAKLPLFDRYIKRPNYNHIIERLKDVTDSYLHDDKEALFEALMKNELISEKLIHKIKHNEYKFNKKLAKKAKKGKA